MRLVEPSERGAREVRSDQVKPYLLYARNIPLIYPNVPLQKTHARVIEGLSKVHIGYYIGGK